MGLQGILAQLKSNKIDLIQMEREIFDEETSLDYEDMRCRFNRKDVIEKILSASPDGSLTIAVFTGSIQCSHSIALDADISVHQIIQQIGTFFLSFFPFFFSPSFIFIFPLSSYSSSSFLIFFYNYTILLFSPSFPYSYPAPSFSLPFPILPLPPPFPILPSFPSLTLASIYL